MFAVHVGPTDDPGLSGSVYALPHGRASLLFGLLAGVGVSLMAASASRSRRSLRATVLWRAAVLLPAGLALQLLDHGVNVILQSYALLFVLAALAVGLPDRWLLGLAGLSTVVGSVVVHLGRATSPELFARDPLTWGDPAGELLLGVTVSGPYPLVTWATPLLVGLWIGRRDLRSPRFQRRAAAIGLALGALTLGVSELVQRRVAFPTSEGEPGELLLAVPHSQMPLWLIGGTGTAVGVLGLSLLAADRFPRLIHPLAATGALAFTVYVGHLFVLAAWPDARAEEVGPAVIVLLVGSLAAIALSTSWHDLVGQGPLERTLRPPWSWRSSR
jgi:uncharacterized membrane protein YeiB